MSILFSFEQLKNISPIFVTFDVLKVDKSMVKSDVQAENIPLMSVTFDVLKLLRSICFIFVQQENISPMSVTLEVLNKLLLIKVDNIVQFANMLFMFVTFHVLKLERFKEVSFVHS